jgi:hypothetical protein
MSAKGSLPPKKLPSSSTPVATTNALAGNVTVLPTPETASLIPAAVLQPGFPQASLTFPPTAQSGPISPSLPAQTAGISGPLTRAEGSADNLIGISTSGISSPNLNSGFAGSPNATLASGTGVSAFSTIQEQAAANVLSAETASVGPENGFANGSASAQPMLVAGNTQPPALAFAAAQTTPSSASSTVTAGAPENGSQPEVLGPGTGTIESAMSAPTLLAGNAQTPTPAFAAVQAAPNADLQTAAPEAPESEPQPAPVGLGIGTAVAISTYQAAASAMPAPILLASTFDPVGPAAGVVPSTATNPPSVPADAADAAATESVNQGQGNVALRAGALNALSAIINKQNVAPPSLNLPGRVSLQVPVARAAGVSAASVRGAGQSPVLTFSTSSSVGAGSDTGDELPVAGQTPFSVFFSSAGPGTEAAASTLPKMILPATSATMHNGYMSATETPSASVPSGGAQAVSSPGNVGPNSAPQPSKDPLAASQSGSGAAGQPLHGNAEQGASNIPAAASQPAAPPAPLAPTAVAVPPSGGQPALPADSLPSPQPPPGNAAGGAANLTPAAPPAPSAVPGPVQVAQLVNRLGQSEMRIGMNTSAFGGIEVRTVVHANDVGLIIGSEKGDLRGLLSNEMPAITNTLQQQNLRLNSVSFMQGFASSSNASGGGASQQQRSFVPAPTAANAVSSEAAVDNAVETLPAMAYSGGGGGLSILA